MNLKTFFDNFELLAEAPNGVKKLRELILQLAVMGKLAPQDPDDEPASNLLEKIKAEKEKLVKKGIIKKEKPLQQIEENEIPFEAPIGWQWVRLDNLCQLITKGSSPKWQGINYVESKKGILFITSENVRNCYIDLENPKYVEDKFNQIEPRSILKNGDILMNIVGASIGRTAIYDREDIANINQAVCLIRTINSKLLINIQYLLLFFNSYICINLMFDKQVDNARANLSMGNIAKFLVPLPPLTEQHRIVAKVDQLMKLCDELEARQQKKREARVTINNTAIAQLLTAREPEEFNKSWQRIYNNFDILYSTPENISKLRSCILQLAVMGKLAPQDPHDEPASVLLDKIKADKELLVKEGKIRKIEILPLIDVSEVPFEIPDGWEWARFPELGEFGRGKSKHRPRNDPSLFLEGTYPMVQTGDVARANYIIYTYTGLYNKKGLAQSRLWPKGTLCITIAANIADAALLGFDACFPDSVVGFIPSTQIGQAEYFAYFMRTAKERLQDYAPSTAQKNINLEILGKLLIPLPPLAEQHRIVARVKQLMTLCDQLEAQLKQSVADSEKLMETAVRQFLDVNTIVADDISVQPTKLETKTVKQSRNKTQSCDGEAVQLNLPLF